MATQSRRFAATLTLLRSFWGYARKIGRPLLKLGGGGVNEGEKVKVAKSKGAKEELTSIGPCRRRRRGLNKKLFTCGQDARGTAGEMPAGRRYLDIGRPRATAKRWSG